MGFLDRFRKPKELAAARKMIAAKPDPRGFPGMRVYHEYVVDEQPVNGRYGWGARVYGADSAVHQMSGSDESAGDACRAALAWAESKKAELRGEK